MIEQKIRLHITPLSSDLLSAVLPSKIAPLAENISYYTLQTFPENNYGYLELPSMEAEKLKKKLNGSILKGKKIRVEEAHPRKRAFGKNEEGAQDVPTAQPIEAGRRPKRTKHDPATISGHELSPDRKVKRGWTEPKNAKARKSARGNSDQAPSKYTNREEVLFRTKLPVNKTKAPEGHSKKDNRNSRDILVHEFEKSTIQPSFLREEGASDIKTAVAYVDGRGWINEDGVVVEGEPGTVRKKENKPSTTERSLQIKAKAGKAPPRAGSEALDGEGEPDDETSSAGSSSDSESNQTASSSQLGGSKPTSAEESETQHTPTPSVHPLEAIFKRPTKAASVDIAKPSLEVQTSFSFFEPDHDTTAAATIPDTPFNSQELRSRELRSAAPTPDTAAPSRFNSWGSRGEDDSNSEDDEEEGTLNPAGAATPSKTATSVGKGRPESDFAKFFWEHRGENNRTWKRRAREAKKEKRQRENRQRGRRV